MTSSTPSAPVAAPTDAATAGAGLDALVRWATTVRASDLPDDVRERALLVLADDLAAMIAVRDDPQVLAVRDSLVHDGQPAEATVFGTGRRRGERAAVAGANGAAGDWAEMDEGYRPATCHAGLYVLPALLAEIEHGDRTGEELVTALVSGYEVVTRVARTWRHAEMVIHPHALLGPIGAAAGAALGSGLSPDHAVAAVSAGAGAAMLGPFDHALTGALARNVWPGIAAWTGVQVARWAVAGIGGDPTAPHSAFSGAMGATAELGLLTADLGTTWAIRDGYHKRFACCQYAHSTVEALLDARDEIGSDRVDGITSIVVRTHPLALKLHDARPATSLAAKFSVPHAAAAALVLGAVDADACGPAALADPRIAALRDRIVLEPFLPAPAPPHDRPATVVVTLQDGTVIERTCMSAIGSPDRPLSREALIDDKILGAVGAAHPGFVPTVRRLLEQPDLLRRPWRAILDDLLEG
ncbi:MmgE/PrpD family protein [Patulibacter minatonensis]|uniref:MmgE/PrpD family protein n=1 Tax=Patulibacter minatonensis TaxID=298163 RepID=UPI000683F41C|nr:MmgE/PrpD family protein [Patulibacter minatonensis]